MKKHRYIVTLDLSEAMLIDRIKSFMSKSQLTDDEQDDLNDYTYQLQDYMTDHLVDGVLPTMIKLHETNMVNWLPVGGTIQPVDGIAYLVSDGRITEDGIWSEEDHTFWCDIQNPTHYAEYPVYNQ